MEMSLHHSWPPRFFFFSQNTGYLKSKLSVVVVYSLFIAAPIVCVVWCLVLALVFSILCPSFAIILIRKLVALL